MFTHSGIKSLITRPAASNLFLVVRMSRSLKRNMYTGVHLLRILNRDPLLFNSCSSPCFSRQRVLETIGMACEYKNKCIALYSLKGFMTCKNSTFLPEYWYYTLYNYWWHSMHMELYICLYTHCAVSNRQCTWIC